MEVIDNFLPREEFLKFQNVIMGGQFPWFFQDYTLSPDRSGWNGHEQFSEDSDTFQFTHMMFKPNRGVVSPEAYNICVPILNKLGLHNLLIRLKANLNPRQNDNQILGAFHVDVPYPNTNTAIFYCNTNNGYTEFKDGKKVPSVANRMVVFDSKTMHVGYTCTDAKSRVVLNINYLPSKY